MAGRRVLDPSSLPDPRLALPKSSALRIAVPRSLIARARRAPTPSCPPTTTNPFLTERLPLVSCTITSCTMCHFSPSQREFEATQRVQDLYRPWQVPI